MVVGEYVETWWDSGAMGASILYGVVVAAGPKTITVRWESGIQNRIQRGDSRVKLARSQSIAKESMA